MIKRAPKIPLKLIPDMDYGRLLYWIGYIIITLSIALMMAPVHIKTRILIGALVLLLILIHRIIGWITCEDKYDDDTKGKIRIN